VFKAKVLFETLLKEQKVNKDVDVKMYSVQKSQRPPSPSQPKLMHLQVDEEGGIPPG